MKIGRLLLIFVCVSILLCGCNSWMDGSYYSVKPHLEDSENQLKDSAEVESYAQLQELLVALVGNGRQSSVIYMPDFQPSQITEYMDRAILYITQNNAIGAYAVETVTYEIGTNAGRNAIAVEIAYLHSRSEILRILQTETMDEAFVQIAAALEDCEAGIVLRVEKYAPMDLTQLVEDYVNAHPDRCMEMPQVAVAVYPETGADRVLELTFTYQTSRETLRSMKNYVEPIFAAADLNVSGEEDQNMKFTRMYAFLMERSDYQLETSINPAYSLLRHGVGDSKAFASVYAAMCRRAELDCQVVSGTRQGEPWVWNLICEDGVYYHIDLLRSSSVGEMEKLTPEQMQGYVWDYSAYPESGTAMDAETE